MFKPHTIEQFKVMEYLKVIFSVERLIVSPDSRTALRIEDETGDSLVFGWRDGRAVKVPASPVPSKSECQAFIKAFLANPASPPLQNLEDIVRWWHAEDRPISLQQALNLPDDLYRHYLTHEVYSTEEVCRLAITGLMTEEEYLSVRLWYRDGNSTSNWVGPEGTDGTGNLYGIAFRDLRPNYTRFVFYVMDDYYREMNGPKGT